MKRKKLILLPAVFALASCTQVTLEPMPDKSDITIHMDWQDEEVPAGMKYHFYPVTDGTATEMEGTATEFKGQLPYGRYTVLVHNTDARHITFTGMENLATATAQVDKAVITRGDGLTLIEQPGMLYSFVTAELEVPRLDAAETTAIPKPVMRSLQLSFNLSSVDGVNTIEGWFCGIYPSMLLSTGVSSDAAKKEAPLTATRFNETVTSEYTTTTIAMLGILNPEGGNIYQNILRLRLKGNDGWLQEINVDLTQVLTDILSTGQGDMQLELPNEIEIKVEPTSVGLTAKVSAWIRAGEGDGEIDYYYY